MKAVGSKDVRCEGVRCEAEKWRFNYRLNPFLLRITLCNSVVNKEAVT